MRIRLVNPSDVSFGTAVITPRWQYVLAAATPVRHGTPLLIDETLEAIDEDSIQAGDVVGIGIHTGNALRGYRVGQAARARGAFAVFGGIHATLFPEEAREHGGAHAVVTGDGDVVWAQVLDDGDAGRLQPLYAGGRVATDSARVRRSARWARWLARSARRLFASEPMPELREPRRVPSLSGIGAVLALMALIPASGVATSDPARTFLTTAFNLTSSDIGHLDRDGVISRTLEVENRREIATLGIVRIRTSPSRYVERLTDIVSFKRTNDVVQIGTFGTAPQWRDVETLTIDEPDLKRLRECRVDNCGVRLPAGGIERVRQIDWHAPDAPQKATVLLRQMLVDYVARYRQAGAAAAMEYADREPRLNVGREFASLVAADSITSKYTPRLRAHLLDPVPSAPNMTDFVYWSKELVRGRPVVSITHVAIAPAIDDSPVAYAVASKQIYAMHYYDASLGLTLLVPDRTAPVPTMYVVYVNRSRIDLFDGLFGGVARHIVAGRARGVVAEQLRRLQRVLCD